MNTSLRERIAARTLLMPSGCIEWQGSIDPAGYGRITVAGKPAYVHREAFKLRHGSIPEGKFILHSCDNPPCCNPDHLRAGTQAENVQDRKDRGRRTYDPYAASKLTPADVRTIRVLHEGGMSQSAIGRQIGVSQGSVSKIVRRLAFAGEE
jgi:hypothetical protein